jgi:hypothetical protein
LLIGQTDGQVVGGLYRFEHDSVIAQGRGDNLVTKALQAVEQLLELCGGQYPSVFCNSTQLWHGRFPPAE